MRNLAFCLILLFALTATTAHAGAGHEHAVELSQSQVLEKASAFVARIVEKGQLEESWKEVKPQKAKENSRHEWVVVFSNPEIKDRKKQTLYMFLTLSGEYIAANFTGK
jgi:hypothetical protein